MDGNTQSITQSIQSNQFQGRMVVSVLIVVILIVLDRYVYLRHVSRAIQDAAEEIKPPITITRTYNLVSKPSQELEVPKYDNFRRNSDVKIGDIINLQLMETSVIKKVEEKKVKENERNTILIIKLILHGALVIVVHVIIFWYFPMNGNYKLQGSIFCEGDKVCNNFQENWYLKVFYILYLAYLILASNQIRHGLPSFTKVSFPLMRHISTYSSNAFKVYRGTPFLFELRTLID